MQRISERLQQINANNYTCYKTIWWQSQMLEWVHPHKHQHGTILYTYYTVSSYFQPAQAYGMNSTHVRLMTVFVVPKCPDVGSEWHDSRIRRCSSTVVTTFTRRLQKHFSLVKHEG